MATCAVQLELGFDGPDEPVFDWADPDSYSEEVETALWYRRTCDPYLRWDPPRPESPEFWLGTHRPNWMHPGRRKRRPDGPLFISARALRGNRRTPYPPADTDFAIDSGGFTELFMHGRWTVSAQDYAEQVQGLARQTGRVRWAAIQDWMVEPWIVDGGSPPWGGRAAAGTGLTVAEHQRRTVASYLELRELAPSIRWLPVVQGQTLDQYLEHVELYRASGVTLAANTLVGVGSVCRRQRERQIAEILAGLSSGGLRLHGFGVKITGFELAAEWLDSADSMAWSKRARAAWHHREPGARAGDANDPDVAEAWRRRVVAAASSRPRLLVAGR